MSEKSDTAWRSSGGGRTDPSQLIYDAVAEGGASGVTMEQLLHRLKARNVDTAEKAAQARICRALIQATREGAVERRPCAGGSRYIRVLPAPSTEPLLPPWTVVELEAAPSGGPIRMVLRRDAAARQLA